MASKKNVTFADIAKYTGFSKTTISRYFNNPDSLTEKNQEIIKEALEKLNYKENKVARILANGQTEFIGIIVPDMYHHYYSEVLNELLNTYEQFGYKFLVFVGNTKEEIERKYIKELMAYKIEGLIILSHTIPSIELADLKIPVVTIEREDQFVSSVNTDNYVGGQMAAKLLHDSGCEILMHVHSDVPNKKIPAFKRMKGFGDYCEEHHLDYEFNLKELTFGHEQTIQAMKSVMEDLQSEKYKGKKKGVSFSSDTYANVFLNLLLRTYGDYPDDIYIVGYDNSSISRESVLTISTIGQEIDKIAQSALDIIDQQIADRKENKPTLTEPVHRYIMPVLYERETTTHKL